MVITATERLVVKGEGSYSRKNSMLTDVHIHKFNEILQLYSNFEMQSTLLLQRPEQIVPVPFEMNYVQILFSGNAKLGHWIIIYKEHSLLHLYDSANCKQLKNEHLTYMSHLFPYHSACQITFENLQPQSNSYDCGVFAITHLQFYNYRMS